MPRAAPICASAAAHVRCAAVARVRAPRRAAESERVRVKQGNKLQAAYEALPLTYKYVLYV
jgi:hypothetical protein